MNIGLVSDTHLPRFGKALPAALRDALQAHQVELILHMGDFTQPQVIDLFTAIAPVDAVAGNNDPAEITARFGRKKILELEGVRIGMVHGDGMRKTTVERAWDAFAGEKVDVILFGHSHMPYCQQREGTWLINPGSPTDKRRNPEYSYGILEVSAGHVTPHLFFYSDKS